MLHQVQMEKVYFLPIVRVLTCAVADPGFSRRDINSRGRGTKLLFDHFSPTTTKIEEILAQTEERRGEIVSKDAAPPRSANLCAAFNHSIVSFHEINSDSQVVISNARYPGTSYKYPFQDPSLPWDQRVDDLVGRLTIDEIAKQTAVRIKITLSKNVLESNLLTNSVCSLFK